MSKVFQRGFDINDKKWFSNKEIIKLSKAKEEIEWLINRDYKIDSVVNFVGDRYQFSLRQRNALKRATCTEGKKLLRKSKLLDVNKINEDTIYIDGFNLIITLEVALSKGTLIRGSDGLIRDLAGLRGTYKLIDKTDYAIELIGKFLDEKSVPSVIFYLDSPVSNSGNLKLKILDILNLYNIKTEVILVNNADVILENLDRVVTSDAAILDKCISYFDLSTYIIEKYINEANIIDLSCNY